MRCCRVEFEFYLFSILTLLRVIGLLLAKGYMELEETLMQWKQKTHLLRILEVSCEQHYVCDTS